MAESVMAQEMKSWLKGECVDTGKAMSNDRRYIARIRDYLVDGDYESADAITDKLKGNMDFHARKGYINPELPSIIHGKIRDIINDFRMGEAPGEFERIRSAIGKFENLVNEADLRLFESVVECQIGKPEGGVKMAKNTLIGHLAELQTVVMKMSNLYDKFPELNEEVNIEKIIPMSLDEWVSEIGAKVVELKGE